MSIHPNSVNIAAMVPQEWLVKLEQLSQKTGRSIEELIREALAQYLGIEKKISPSQTLVNVPLAMIQQDLTTLKQKVNHLEQLFPQVTTLEAKLFSLEKILIPELSTLPNSQTFTQVVPLDDDEQYDEPDEILTDFLSE